MDEQARLEAKLDKVLEHVVSLDITVAKQEVHLAEHIRRTALNEAAIEKVQSNMLRAATGLAAVLGAGLLTWVLK